MYPRFSSTAQTWELFLRLQLKVCFDGWERLVAMNRMIHGDEKHANIHALRQGCNP
jgi:hypothetical protein